MASKPIELLMKVKADSSQVPSGLKGMTDGLTKVQKGAADTEAAIKDIGNTPVKITIQDEAIQKSRARIRELQDEIAKAKTLDINADTTAAQREISKLRSGIKVLEQTVVDVPVTADTTGAETGIAKVKAGVRGLLGLKASIPVDVDTTGAESSIARLKASVGGLGGAAKDAAGGGGFGGLTTALTAFLPPQVKAGVAIAGVSIALGKMAADAETARLSFQGILGSAEKANAVFEDIRQFGADTPFEFPELADAGKKLLAFGVSSEDLLDTLRNIGEASAAVGAPIGDLASIYGQMVAKGKVANEELLQLTERGINGYDILAKKLGITSDEVRELATQGKLGKDAVEALGRGIGETFGGSLALQADSFNGQMSTLSDNFHQIGVDLGSLVLPVMKDFVGFLNTNIGAIGSLTHNISEWDTTSKRAVETSDEWWGSLLRTSFGIEKVDAATIPAVDNTKQLKAAQEEAARAAEWQKEKTQILADEVERLKGEVEKTTTAMQTYFQTLGQETANQDSFTRSLIAFGESVKENKNKFDDNSVAALNNREALRNVAAQAGQLTGTMAEQGGTVAEVSAKMQTLRDDFIRTAVSMGVPKKKAEELADQYKLIPKDVETTMKAKDEATAKLNAAKTAADQLNGKVATVTVRVNYDAKYAAMDRAQAASLGAVVAPSSYGLPASPEVSAYASRLGAASTGRTGASRGIPTAAPLAAPTMPANRTYTINVNVERGVPTAEVGRQIVEQIRAFERAAGRSWRA